MIKASIIGLLLSLSLNIIAQYDPSAKVHLDHLAKAIKESEGIKIDFEVKVSKLGSEELVNNDTGSLLLKKNSYVLQLNGTTTYCDGKDQWVLLEEEREVTVQPLEEDEVTAASIFTLYENGYRFRKLGEGEGKVIVELTPEDRNSPYVRISLYINEASQQLDAFTLQSKNAILTSVNITSWQSKALTNKDFQFNQEENPEVEIIDLR